MPILKKVIFLLSISFFCIGSIFAGDIPESLMVGDQKALFIGILSKNADECILNPKTIMMGDINNDPIIVDCFDRYYGTQEKPKDGDIVVAVLNHDLTLDPWLFKVTSEDYSKLKLVSERYDMAERYEKYINEGKYFEAWDKKIAQQIQIDNTPALETENYSIYYGMIILILLSVILFLIKKNKVS